MAGQARFLKSRTLAMSLFLLSVVTHLPLVGSRVQPCIFTDEAGYLSQARYFAKAGVLMNHDKTAYYHFGYSLLITPALWLFEDEETAYQAVVVLNAIFLGALFLGLYALLKDLFDLNPGTAALISFVCALYPSFIVEANLAWAESALIPLYIFCCLSYAKLTQEKNLRWVLLFALLTGFLYMVHPRTLPASLVSGVFLVLLGVTRNLRWQKVVPGITTLLLILLLTQFCKALLSEMMQADFDLGTDLENRLTPAYILLMARAAIGQGLYLSLATLGLFPLGLISVLQTLTRRRPLDLAKWLAERTTSTLLFILTSSFSLFSLSVFFMASGERLDHQIYGRYNEIFVGAFMGFGIVYLIELREQRSQIMKLAMLLIVSLTALGALFLLTLGYKTAPVEVTIMGITPWIQILGTADLATVGLTVLAVTSILLIAFHRRVFLGLVSTGIIFLLLNFFLISWFSQHFPTEELRLLRPLESLEPLDSMAYDMLLRKKARNFTEWVRPYFLYQYYLPKTVFETADTELGELPESKAFVSHYSWAPPEDSHLVRVAEDPFMNTALFVRKEFVPDLMKGWDGKILDLTDFKQEWDGRPLKVKAFNSYLLLGYGWAYPDSGGVWSISDKSTLSFLLPQVLRGGFRLTFKGHYLNGEEPTTIMINGEYLTDSILTDNTILVPSTLLEDRFVTVSLIHKNPVSPYELGLSADTRKLKYNLERIGWSPVRDWDGQWLSIENFETFIALNSGWAHPDSAGVWSISGNSSLSFLLPQELQGGIRLAFKGHYFNGEEPTTVMINGTHLADSILTNATITVPPTFLKNRVVTLSLIHKNPVSPYELGLSADPRKLKYNLERIGWSPLKEQAAERTD